MREVIKPIRTLNRLFVALILSVLSTSTSYVQVRKLDSEHDGFKGRVKTVSYKWAKLSKKSGNLVEGKPTLQRILSYDDNGNRAKEIVYTHIDDIMGIDRWADTRISYRYDKQGNRTEEILRNPRGENYVGLFRRVFKHDPSGNRVQESIYGRGFLLTGSLSGSVALVGIYNHEYDSNGRRTITTYTRRGLVIGRWEYVNDESGNAKEISYYRGSLLYRKESYEYQLDEMGNWVKKVVSNWDMRKNRYEPQEIIYRSIEHY